MARLDLLIFDCDGVLVDTERVANELLCEALGALGIDLGFERTVETFKGLSGRDCTAIIERLLGRPPPAGLVERCRAQIIERFEAEPRAIPGIHEALAALDHPMCVASSGDHAKMQCTLGTTGLLHHFDGAVFSATEVARGKPHPDLFLHAASRMSAAPERCIVIEDSVPGIEGARAAGMAVLGYVDLTPAAALSAAGATACFDDMRELHELITRLETP